MMGSAVRFRLGAPFQLECTTTTFQPIVGELGHRNRYHSMLGHRVDGALSDNLLIRLRRADLGLIGDNGEAPGRFELLTAKHRLAADPSMHVLVSFDEASRMMRIERRRGTRQRESVTLAPKGRAAGCLKRRSPLMTRIGAISKPGTRPGASIDRPKAMATPFSVV